MQSLSPHKRIHSPGGVKRCHVASGGVTTAAGGVRRCHQSRCQVWFPRACRLDRWSAAQEAHGSTWPAVHVARGGRVDGRVGSVNARHARRATSGADDRQRGVSVIAVGRLKLSSAGTARSMVLLLWRRVRATSALRSDARAALTSAERAALTSAERATLTSVERAALTSAQLGCDNNNRITLCTST